ncbi:MAG: hypothetical protein ABWY27_13280 [Telluria sp.]
MNYRLDQHALTAVTTWQDWRHDHLADFEEIPQVAMFSAGPGAGRLPR